jgi:hypothetical protein
MRAKIVLTLLALMLLLPAAAARAESISEGSVNLTFGNWMTRQLRHAEVLVRGIGPASAGSPGITIPVTSGATDTQYGSGYFYLGGGFRLQVGKRKAIVKRLVVNTSKHALNAVVDGIAVKVATLPPQRASLDGFDFELTLRSLKLTPKAAATFNRRLGLDGVFKAGRSLGSAEMLVHLESLRVSGGQINVTIDNAFREKLQAVEADVSSPALSVAIQNGQLGFGLKSGGLFGESGFTFIQKGKEPYEFTIGFLTSAIALESGTLSGTANVSSGSPRLPFTGAVATFPNSIPIRFDSETGEASASGLPAALAPDLAGLLNEVFGTPKGKPSYFTPGELFGTVGFTAQTR